jgi:hypothetical protein
VPYGCTYFYQRGDEYIRLNSGGDPTDSDHSTRIFPFMDFKFVPGVTSPAFRPDFDRHNGGTLRSTHDGDFVGNVDNENYGVTTMLLDKDYDNDLREDFIREPVMQDDGTYEDEWVEYPEHINEVNISAKKAWFHFGDEIIALGSDISSTDENVITSNTYNVNTTITQVLYTNSHSSGTDGNAKYYFHDGIAYIGPNSQTYDFPDPAVGVSGDWETYDNCEDDCNLSGNVFRLSINHSNLADDNNDPNDDNNNTKYFYRVVPGISATQATTYNTDNPIEYFNDNDSNLQWVVKTQQNGDILAGIVYYEGFTPGTVVQVTPEGPEIIIIVEDKTVVKDEIVNVPVRVQNFSAVEAYQLGIKFNSQVLKKQNINPADLNGAADPDNFGLTEMAMETSDPFGCIMMAQISTIKLQALLCPLIARYLN